MQAAQWEYGGATSAMQSALRFTVSDEDQARADFYALLARLFVAPPDAALLASLAGADSLASRDADNPLENAWEMLVVAAGELDGSTIASEFNDLFIHVGTPQINPYASLYLAGFINEKPLATLRTRLAELGLSRLPGAFEMEDHLAALCETMRLLITGGEHGRPHTPAAQQRFFDQYLGSWAPRCLDDIEQAPAANFYRHVARFTRAFFSIESQAFEIEAATAAPAEES